MSAINATPLTQEQLKVASFCSQLDADGRDDNNKGDDNVVDEDNDNFDKDNGQAEGLLEVARTEARLQAQQSVWAGRGWRTSPPRPPTAGGGGGDGNKDTKNKR